jgi:hypothetical protein
MQRNLFLHALMILLWGIVGLRTGSLLADEPARVRRFALIAGANSGGSERIVLRYAESDARAFAGVLHEIGGVHKQDELLILESSRDALLDGLHRMRSRLAQATDRQTRLELIFYYSGHSDERGLLLGEDILTFAELKQELNGLPARVKIGILDSCASGALVRLKGGHRTAPFLIDDSTEVRGYAFLTSSSADENAQESERIGASYFTHYLISGMRGAADNNRDGRVTLNESYAYAFDETLNRTVASRGGAQHPNYDFQLAGAGDLVLTDLRSTDAVIALAPGLVGRVFVRDMNGRLVAEINKTTQRKVQIALPRGRYNVSVESGGELRSGIVRLQPGAETGVSGLQLTVVEKKGPAGSKGSGGFGDDVIRRKFGATVFAAVSTNPPGKVENRLAANVIGSGYSLRGGEVGLVRNKRDYSVRGIQHALLMNQTLHLRGIQLGALNVAGGDVAGVQQGYINLAGHFEKGMQLGVFNATNEKSDAYQLGVINYMPDGQLSFGAWTTDTALFNVGVKLGGRHTFSRFTVGTRAYSAENWVSLGYGFGFHFELKNAPLWLEPDVSFNWLMGNWHDMDNGDFLFRYNLAFGVRLYNSFSFFAGPLINFLLSENRSTVAVAPALKKGRMSEYNYEISPGFFAGFQIEPRMGRFNTWKGNLDD